MPDTRPSIKPEPRLFMWAGGKNRMLQHYVSLLPRNALERPFIEPFAGGAALFNHLSSMSPISATLSDVNADLMDVYRLVRDDPRYLVEINRDIECRWLALPIPDRKALYYDLRSEYWDMPQGRETTARLYFLMKTGFNGIWQTCKASHGRFGTPVGLANQKERVLDASVIETWSRKLQQTRLLNGGYQDVPVQRHAFVFCDPPYRDSFTSYGTDFDDQAQIDLISWCREINAAMGATVWLSNRDAGDGFFETHAPDARIARFPITYTAGRRKKTAEGFTAKKATELLLIWE